MLGTFGRYQLVEKLATGGMGEVFLARVATEKGAEAELVIKRILPNLSGSQEFVQLFLDEARIASRLSHPNIVQLYELGVIEGAWYLAMELIDGPDLRMIQHEAMASGKPLPPGVACRIACDVAAALDYAHRVTDPDGTSLDLIHRDVSPQNVLVGFDGQVKLTDFGIAKAANRFRETRTGVLRGKCSYMSPEQAEGQVVDLRTDLFALGVVFWELLTGARLFRASTEVASLRLVSRCEVPRPSEVAGRVPPALDEVCLRALAREPAERFESAQAMREAIEAVARAEGLDASPEGLQGYLAEVFGPRSSWMRKGAPADSGYWAEAFRQATPVERSSAATVAVGQSKRPERQTSSFELTEAELDPDELEELDPEIRQPLIQVVRPRRRLTGRARELSRLERLLLCGERLVTLVGAAGVGKSRLAQEVAAREAAVLSAAPRRGRPGAVLVVPLRGTKELRGLCAAMAEATGVALLGQTPEEWLPQLGHALGALGETLLVLDDFDALAKHAAESVGRWLAAARQARIIVTSRAPLRLAQELSFELEPLPAAAPGASELGEAVRLLAERIAEARPGYRLGKAEQAHLEELARRLEGNPLALELAAAASPEALPPSGTAGPVELAAGWAWSSLSEEERGLLSRLSVFQGGFTPESAAAVLEGGGAEAVRSLAGRGLLWEREEGRLELSEPLLPFAQQALREGGAEREARARHAAHVLGLAGRAEELRVQRENLRAVLEDALAAPGPESALAALAAAMALEPQLARLGLRADGVELLSRALERAAREGLGPAEIAPAMAAKARARQAQGKLVEAAAEIEQALEVARVAADGRTQGRLHCDAAALLRARGRAAPPRGRLADALALSRRAADLRTEAEATWLLGCLEQGGDGAVALELLRSSVGLARRAGEPLLEASALASLGAAEFERKPGMAALGLLEDALALYRRHGERRQVGRALAEVGSAYRALGLAEEAHRSFLQSAEAYRAAGIARSEALSLVALATFEQEQLRLPDADRHLRRACWLFQELGDERWTGVILSRISAGLAMSERTDDAAASLERAEKKLASVDADLSVLLAVAAGHLQLAKARAEGEGRVAQAIEERLATLGAAAADAGTRKVWVLVEPRQLVIASVGCLRRALGRG